MWVSLLDFYAPATKWDGAYSFTLDYDGPNGSLFISILLHNSEFRILNSEFRICFYCEFRNSEFGIVKYI